MRAASAKRNSRACAGGAVAEYNGTGFVFQESNASSAHSTITDNGTGINLLHSIGAITFGDNHIKGSTTNVTDGILTNVGTQ